MGCAANIAYWADSGYPMAFGYPAVGLACSCKEFFDQAISFVSLDIL